MQFFKNMFDASQDKEVTPKKRNPSRSRGSRGKSNVIDKVKSPSDTTIYAPALNKGIIRDSIGTNRAPQMVMQQSNPIVRCEPAVTNQPSPEQIS